MLIFVLTKIIIVGIISNNSTWTQDGHFKWLKTNLLMDTLVLKNQWIKNTMFYMYYKEPSLIIIINWLGISLTFFLSVLILYLQCNLLMYHAWYRWMNKFKKMHFKCEDQRFNMGWMYFGGQYSHSILKYLVWIC